MADPQGVHHHILLRRRGGAANVARMLARFQTLQRPVSLSFELDEPGDGLEAFPSSPCSPGELACRAPQGSIVHVHGSRNWPALLEGFSRTPRPMAVTVHDCTLITGGCVYPAGCPKHEPGCPDPCPRDYPDTKRIRALKKGLVASVRPYLVSPSSWLAGLLRREWPDLPVAVIPNGVDIPDKLVDRDEARARLGMSRTSRIVLFLAHGGERAAYKGGDKVLSLLARIAGLCPGTLGVVAGGAEETSREKDLIRYPYLEGEHLSLVLRASDVLVYPSLADNHPLIVLEAMAHGVPVLAYGVGGIPEQVVDAATGFLRPYGDEDGLARKAAAILLDPGLARSMGAESRERALRHFPSMRMSGGYDRLYERIARDNS